MKPSELEKYAEFCIKNNLNLLVTGQAGIGKSDILSKVAAGLGADLVLEHGVVSDPVDYKGLPFMKDGQAEFLPFRNLRKIIDAERLTVYFMDDLGQCSESVQKAFMQILLARQVGEHKISDHVRFVAATHRKQDKAGVTGLLEPVKSRFRGGIVELVVDHRDWCVWALEEGNMPLELISFIRFKPDIIDNPSPASKDLVNTASPRTVASVGMAQKAGLPKEFEHEAFKGIAGEAFAAEYTAFLKLMRDLPTIDQIILDPKGVAVPKEAGNLYALCAGLANRMTAVNIENILTYLYRITPEFRVMCMKDATIRHKGEITNTRAYIDWSVKEGGLLNL